MAISLFNAYYDKSMGDLTNEILASGQIANGKYVALFSESFAKKNGNSCRSLANHSKYCDGEIK